MSYFWMVPDWLADGFMEEEGGVFADISLREGRRLDMSVSQPVRFTTTPKGHPAPSASRYPPHLEDGAVPAMSGALMAALCKAGVDNLQTWPAVVLNPDSGQMWSDYVVFNLVGLIDCVDLGASTGTTLMDGAHVNGPPPLVDLTTIVLKRNVSPGLKMFREHLKGNLIVGDDVVDALKRSPPPERWGIRLIPLNHSGADQ